jgi:pentatricopeptide repeat protein
MGCGIASHRRRFLGLQLLLFVLVASPSSFWICQAFLEPPLSIRSTRRRRQSAQPGLVTTSSDSSLLYFRRNHRGATATHSLQVWKDPRYGEATGIRPRQSPGPASPRPSSRDRDRADTGSRSESSRPTSGSNKDYPALTKKKKYAKTTAEDVRNSGEWDRAVRIESMLLSAVDALQQSIAMSSPSSSSSSSNRSTIKNENGVDTKKKPPQQLVYVPLSFPGIRDCNAALSTFGDGHDLLRALRMFGKMRKAAALSQRRQQQQPYVAGILPPIPSPTLVTYSTIMSRAIHLGKPLVALRLWNLMRQQQGFFYHHRVTAAKKGSSSMSPTTSSSYYPSAILNIVPDVKAANILMNCYAKLGDVASARDLLEQMLDDNGGPDVPHMRPNLVTYNTLLDACHKRGELDVALELKEQMEHAGLRPDARTYTTLIATVARKASSISGAHDPTPAFEIHQEMKLRNVRPNGMTYSALIDVCARCRRADFALKGLRSMLDQKAQERKELDLAPDAKYTLTSEVGAWTSVINACGKCGRLDSAIRLFYAMPKFGVYPNTVTCGCLTDSLLKHGRTAETLEVLRYMKRHNIVPSAVMYTSLMISAGRLVQFEKHKQPNDFRRTDTTTVLSGNLAAEQEKNAIPVDESGETKAIEVYTELIISLMQGGGRPRWGGAGPPSNAVAPQDWRGDLSTDIFKVFLVFQEMKAVGASPDLACYNALLKMCAIAGDVQRAEAVLQQLLAEEDLEPNDKSFRDTMRAASKAQHSDSALSTWKTALAYRGSDKKQWTPSMESLLALVQTFVGCASDDSGSGRDAFARRGLYYFVVNLYTGVMSSAKRFLLTEAHRMGMDRVNQEQMLHNPGIMLLFLQAAVAVGNSSHSEVKQTDKVGRRPNWLRQRRQRDRSVAISILRSPCLQEGIPPKYQRNVKFNDAYRIAQSWAQDERTMIKPRR